MIFTIFFQLLSYSKTLVSEDTKCPTLWYSTCSLIFWESKVWDFSIPIFLCLLTTSTVFYFQRNIYWIKQTWARKSHISHLLLLWGVNIKISYNKKHLSLGEFFYLQLYRSPYSAQVSVECFRLPITTAYRQHCLRSILIDMLVLQIEFITGSNIFWFTSGEMRYSPHLYHLLYFTLYAQWVTVHVTSNSKTMNRNKYWERRWPLSCFRKKYIHSL